MNATINSKRPLAVEEDAAILLQGEISAAIQFELGLKPCFADQYSILITNHLRRNLGSQRIYIPAPSRAERDAAIFRDYNGSNAGDVCQRYQVSRTRLHEICAAQRALKSARSPVSCLKTGSIIE